MREAECGSKDYQSTKGGPMNRILYDYFRCQEILGDFKLNGSLSQDKGFFRWGEDVLCYGRSTSGIRSGQVDRPLYDVSNEVILDGPDVSLPFDASEVVENLLRERYSAHFRQPESSHTRRFERSIICSGRF